MLPSYSSSQHVYVLKLDIELYRLYPGYHLPSIISAILTGVNNGV